MFKRGKAKIPKDYITEDIYEYYKSTAKDPVDYKTFQNFLFTKGSNEGIIKKLTDRMLYKAYIWSTPLGDMFIKKYKPKIKFKPNGDLDIRKSHIRVDWANTLKLWKSDPEAREEKRKVYHLNKHSQGYLFKFTWQKRNKPFKNKSVYKFKPVRKLDRELTTIIKSNRPDIDFYEITY